MNEQQAIDDLKSIRSMMEASGKYFSLSGLSGLWAGVVALAGSVLMYSKLQELEDLGMTQSDFFTGNFTDANPFVRELISIAVGVLIISLVGGFLFTRFKAKRFSMPVWNKAAAQMFAQMGVVLVPGGLLLLGLIQYGNVGMLVPVSLVFYGIAIYTGAKYTRKEVQGFGVILVTLGILAMFLPAYSLLIWAAGFGLGHVVYGLLIYYKYDRAEKD